MLVHLIRHGTYALLNQALGGRAEHPLSDEGRWQSERLATTLAARPIAAVISSPVRRARETAAPIALRLRLTVALDDAFNEIDFADWTGKRFDELHEAPAWHAWNTFRGTAGVPGGETMASVQLRALTGLLRLAAVHTAGELVIVSHADVIKVVLMHFLGAPLDLMQRLEIAPASISRIALHADHAHVLAVNLPP